MTIRTKYLLTIVTLFTAFKLGTAVAAAVEESRMLTWAINSAPPFHVLSGPMQDKGMCDAFTDAVERALPALYFRTTIMPQTRIGVEFERDTKQCFPCMIYNPGQHPNVHFTEPTHWYPPHGVITTPELAEQLSQEFGNPIQLSALLESNDYRFGYPDGRRFGQLQTIIDSHAGDSNYRVLRTGDDATTAILEMIRANRVHFTIDYPALVEYDRAVAGSNMAFIPIKEVEGKQVIGAIGCTQNEWGAAMVERINEVLPQVHQDTEFLEVLGEYYRNTPEYFNEFETLIRQHQHGSTVVPNQSSNPPTRPFP
ncbi:MAG: hypothetical protein HLUCCO02_06010 [Idiomarinaceae bacterium HL-53]|nr:MAG: hypothetical protein HLUCCO02_06010 [Idiomarinaceae bacterium HL-53]CUS48109.1 conserved hypothetical protein [Idiomarinaceae bacterium HL-53]